MLGIVVVVREKNRVEVSSRAWLGPDVFLGSREVLDRALHSIAFARGLDRVHRVVVGRLPLKAVKTYAEKRG